MKTIEEIAIESRRYHKDESFKTFNKELTFRMDDWAYGYCQGATDQKAIDEADLQIAKETYYNAGYEIGVSKTIDKACKAFCKMTCVGYNECGRCYADGVCESYQEFKKAMEE